VAGESKNVPEACHILYQKRAGAGEGSAPSASGLFHSHQPMYERDAAPRLLSTGAGKNRWPAALANYLIFRQSFMSTLREVLQKARNPVAIGHFDFSGCLQCAAEAAHEPVCR